MKYNVYAIRDQVGQVYTAPFLHTNNGIALRDLQNRLNSPNESQFKKNAKDYTLCHIGHYDDEEALMTPAAPSIVAHLSDLQIEQ